MPHYTEHDGGDQRQTVYETALIGVASAPQPENPLIWNMEITVASVNMLPLCLDYVMTGRMRMDTAAGTLAMRMRSIAREFLLIATRGLPATDERRP